MSDTEKMIFSANELIAISTALQAQIEDCQEYLKDPKLTFADKAQLNQVIQYSKSAAARLDTIFKENGINPQKI